MKALNPTLIDIISPPANPWLQSILKGKARSVPPGVQVVRFGDMEDDDAARSAATSVGADDVSAAG
ncbi:MAG: hypothetical protein WCV99_08120 [Sterolibacterium sp.]